MDATTVRHILALSQVAAILIFDETNTIIAASPAMEELAGYEPEELTGLPMGKIVADVAKHPHKENEPMTVKGTADTRPMSPLTFVVMEKKDGSHMNVTVQNRVRYKFDGKILFAGVVIERP